MTAILSWSQSVKTTAVDMSQYRYWYQCKYSILMTVDNFIKSLKKILCKKYDQGTFMTIDSADQISTWDILIFQFSKSFSTI